MCCLFYASQVCTAHCNNVLIERYCDRVYVRQEDLDLHRLIRFEPLLSQARTIDLTSVLDPASVSPLAIQFLASVCVEATQLLFALPSYANLAKAVTRAFGRKPEVVLCPTLEGTKKAKDSVEDPDVRKQLTRSGQTGGEDGDSARNENTLSAERRDGSFQEDLNTPRNHGEGGSVGNRRDLSLSGSGPGREKKDVTFPVPTSSNTQVKSVDRGGPESPILGRARSLPSCVGPDNAGLARMTGQPVRTAAARGISGRPARRATRFVSTPGLFTGSQKVHEGHGERQSTSPKKAPLSYSLKRRTLALRSQAARARRSARLTPERKSCEVEGKQHALLLARTTFSPRPQVLAERDPYNVQQSMEVGVSRASETSASVSGNFESRRDTRGTEDNNPTCTGVGGRDPQDDSFFCVSPTSCQLSKRREDMLSLETTESLLSDTERSPTAENGDDEGHKIRGGDGEKQHENHDHRNTCDDDAGPLRLLLRMLAKRSRDDAAVRASEHFEAVKSHMHALLSAVKEFERTAEAVQQAEAAEVSKMRAEKGIMKDGKPSDTGNDRERKNRGTGRGRRGEAKNDGHLEKARRPKDLSRGHPAREGEDPGLCVADISSAPSQVGHRHHDGAAGFSFEEVPHFGILPTPALASLSPPATFFSESFTLSSSRLSSGVKTPAAASSQESAAADACSTPPPVRGRAAEPSSSEAPRRTSFGMQRMIMARQPEPPEPQTAHPHELSPRSQARLRDATEADVGDHADTQLRTLDVFVFGRTGPFTYRMPPSVPFRKLMRYYRDHAQLGDAAVDFLWVHRNVVVRVSFLVLRRQPPCSGSYARETVSSPGPRSRCHGRFIRVSPCTFACSWA